MSEEITVPADLKVDIRDPRIADGITPASMQSWVRREGWILRHDAPHAQVWESPDHEDVVMVPLRTDFIDYANRVKDFIDAWSLVHDRSQLAVRADLRAASGKGKTEAGRKSSPRVLDHRLIGEGGPFMMGDGPGYLVLGKFRLAEGRLGFAVCSCGDTSGTLPTTAARMRWFADHKNEVRESANSDAAAMRLAKLCDEREATARADGTEVPDWVADVRKALEGEQ